MRSQVVQQLALAVRQRADLGGQQNAFGGNSLEAITDVEMLTMLNASVALVWDVLTSKFGDFYAWGDGGTGARNGYNFPIAQGKYIYNLPFDFYKEQGVDLGLDGTGLNWATVRPYTLRDRNLFSFPLQTALAYAGWQNLRYQIQGNAMYLLPQVGPLPGAMRLLYSPASPTLVAAVPAAYATATVTTQGALIYASVATNSEPATSQVYVALNSGTTGGSAPAWVVPGYGQPNGIISDNGIQWAYQGPLSLFSTSFDGINGYEDLVILETAIMASVKIEQDVGAMMAQRQQWIERIEVAAANRQAGDPMVISGGFGMCEGGPAYGNGFGPFGGGW